MELSLMMLFPLFGNITAVLIFYSSCPGLLRDRRQGKLTTDPLPYPIACVASLVWCIYAASIRDLLLFIPNFLGVGAAAFNTTTVLRLCREERLAFKLEMTLVVGLWLIAATVLTTMTPTFFEDEAMRKRILGNFAITIVTIQFASPVVESFNSMFSGDASKLNMPLAFAQLANGMLWASYGVIKGDVVIIGPSGAGAVLALITVLTKTFYKLHEQAFSASHAREPVLEKKGGSHIEIDSNAVGA